MEKRFPPNKPNFFSICRRFYNKFGVSPREYNSKVCEAQTEWVKEVYEELGYQVEVSRTQGNGVDLKVKDKRGNLILVAELWNWRYGSNPHWKRLKKVLENLTDYQCIRVLIISTMKEPYRSQLISLCKINQILYVELGKQINPFAACFTEEERKIYRIVDQLPERMKELIRRTIKYPNTVITTRAHVCKPSNITRSFKFCLSTFILEPRVGVFSGEELEMERFEAVSKNHLNT